MEDKEAAATAAGKALQGSQIGKRRVMTTWAVGDAWERFCREKQQVVIRSFRAVRLALPIDGSCDSEISIKGLDSAGLTEKRRDWHLDGLDVGEADLVEISGKDDENESLEFEIGHRGIIM